ncbi:Yip1 family protein [Clostridium sp. DJ247]|uniref:Yip1 family protein n=1 Tax=Clostridium sp. DJ247 TaxID=2726188 RepID=UPI001625F99E|nr:Yip1 family protein [Clostridium sp. DJ247]MBC2580215.1 YIP1 family protein [Clostridium sp. DJ247]
MNIEENQANLTIEKKLIYFFKKPSVLFSEFIEKPKYLWNMLIIIIVSIAYTIMKTTVSMDLIQKSVTDMFKKSSPNASPEIIQKAIDLQTSIPVQIGSVVITTIFIIYITALIYMALTRLFGCKIRYKQLVSIYCLSYLPITIGQVLKWIYMNITNKPLGVNSLINPSVLNAFLDVFDIFNIWQIVLLTIGISVVGKITKKRSFAIVIILFLLSTIISLALFAKNLK